MELEARDANEAKQWELVPGSLAMLPQLRVVLNRFSLVSIKAACDHHWGHGPNSTETGEIPLSLLRENSMFSTVWGTGWTPTRTGKDVVWGLNCLLIFCVSMIH